MRPGRHTCRAVSRRGRQFDRCLRTVSQPCCGGCTGGYGGASAGSLPDCQDLLWRRAAARLILYEDACLETTGLLPEPPGAAGTGTRTQKQPCVKGGHRNAVWLRNSSGVTYSYKHPAAFVVCSKGTRVFLSFCLPAGCQTPRRFQPGLDDVRRGGGLPAADPPYVRVCDGARAARRPARQSPVADVSAASSTV